MAYQQESTAETDWNMGADYLSRLNIQLYYLNEAARIKDVNNMVAVIDRIFAEIAPMMTEDEETTHLERRKEILAAHNKLSQYNTNYQNSGSRGGYNPPCNILDLLFLWELKLRRQIKKAGMLIQLKDKRIAASRSD